MSDLRLLYADVPDTNVGNIIDCTDCIKNGGDWECDHVHCHKGTLMSSDKDASNTNISDIISRKQAIEAMGEEPLIWNDDDEFALGQRSQWKADVEALRELPSAVPKQKKGIMLEKKTWDEFRKTGLTLVINQILHIFGWAITYDVKDGKITNCYPSRTAFRGFDNDSISDSYIKISQWMKDNAEQLLREAKDGDG